MVLPYSFSSLYNLYNLPAKWLKANGWWQRMVLQVTDWGLSHFTDQWVMVSLIWFLHHTTEWITQVALTEKQTQQHSCFRGSHKGSCFVFVILWQAACVEVGMACWAEAIKAYSHACSFQEFQENESCSWFLLAWWNRASWEAVSAQRAAFLGRDRRRKMVLQTIRLCNEFIFLRGREVVSVVSSRDIDYALCSQSACGTPAEGLRGWSQPVSGLGGEKSSDEVVSIQLYKCLSSYSYFCVELDSGADGWQEGTGSRRRSCKKQSGFSVNPTKEGGRIFGQAVVVWELVPGTLQQTLG